MMWCMELRRVPLRASGTVGAESGSGCVFSTTKSWTVTDACGNSGTASQTVSYTRDTTAPMVSTVPGSLDRTLECSNAGGIAAALALAPAATDNCTVSPSIHLVSDVTTPSGTCANGYARVRTWNFTDGCD